MQMWIDLRIDIFVMFVTLSRPLKKGADSLGVLYIGPGALHYIIIQLTPL